jgi:dolichyl-diphosphooligosaccharide--protein glycosyltransferase
MNKLQAFFLNNRATLLLFVGIVAVYFLAVYQRRSDYGYWMENSQNYVVEDVTAMTSMDAYYWLAMAMALDEGTLGKGKVDPRKGYPDLVPFAIKDKPSLLAHFISFTRNFTGDNYYRGGLMLVTVLAGLFVFPLFFYFHRLGFGASAILGGLIGGFGHAYYDRTMMGRVDTDLLNTFFPLAAACLILHVTKEKSWRTNIFLAIGAGLTMYFHTWWYNVPLFILVFLSVMVLHLLVERIHWKQAAFLLLVFLLASGPANVMQSMDSLRTILGAYVSSPPTGLIAWPNILNVVAEAQTRSLDTKFNMLHGFRPLVFLGFAGLLYLCVCRFRQMIPIAPLLAIGGWAMMGPSRFMMYLAPFIGVGVGVLIELLVRYAGKKTKLELKPLLVPLASIVLMFIVFFSTAFGTSFYLNSAPIMRASTIKAIKEIKRIVPNHSAMFTPFWAFSYPLMAIGDFATYHDGGMQGGIRTTLAAKATIATSQKAMVSMLSYLEDFGFNKLSYKIQKDKLNGNQMMDLVFSYPGKFQGENVYVLYFEETIWKIDSLTYFGNWDFERKKSEPMGYVELQCYGVANGTMRCSDGTIDLNRGFMNDGSIDIPLRAALTVKDGYVVDRKNYKQNLAGPGYYLQVLMKKNKVYMILVAEERLFLTNFNQQYLLGNYDRRYFEEVYNNFPVARVLKVKSE